MSFFRSMITAVAVMGLTSSVFAAENTNTVKNPAGDAPQAMQLAGSSAAGMEQTKVDINKATAKELSKIKGLTSAKARAIVAYRKKHGDFKSTDELKDVRGFKKMNEDNLKQIEDQLTTG